MKTLCRTFGMSVVLMWFAATVAQAQLFTRVTSGPVVAFKTPSYGAAFGDYDKDGDLDLVVAGSPREPANVYLNDGNGSFTKLREGQTTSIGCDSYAPTFVDIDNDANLDLFVTNGAFMGRRANHVFMNAGSPQFDLTFSDQDIIASHEASSQNSSWADIDNDGDLDLFVANYNREPNSLYLNNGDGTFAKIDNNEMLRENYSSVGSNWVDYDNDGDADLFVTNYDHDNRLYRNDGDLRFTLTSVDGVSNDKLASSIGASWGDFDNDGDPDLVVTNDLNEKNLLYQNNGDGTFTRLHNNPIVEDGGSSQGSGWADFDNDGDLDLLITNRDAPDALYENQGRGTFARLSSLPGGGQFGSAGLICGDIDNDGDLDLFITRPRGKDLLYINNSSGRNWLNISCNGVFSNRFGVGTKVRVRAVINGKSVWQVREISTNSGAYGQSDMSAHFGLGDAQRADEIRIEWPSGMTDIFTNFALNKFYVATEDKNLVERRSGAATDPPVSSDANSAAQVQLYQNSPNPFNPATTITYSVPQDGMVKLQVFNVLGQKVRTLVNETRPVGLYSVRWDGKDDFGAKVSSGVYVYRLENGNSVHTKKMILME